MGRIIAKRIRGMNWMAKVSFVLIFTLVFSTFMYQGLWKPRIEKAEAASGDVILLWDTANGAVPAGWTNISGLVGDPFYGVFPRAAASYSASTAGSDTHSDHTMTFSNETAGATAGGGTTGSNRGSLATHAHSTWTPAVGAGDVMPPFMNLVFITANNPSVIPANVIAIFDTGALPSGWTRYTALDGNYLRGFSNNATGGAATHTHTASATSASFTGTLSDTGAGTLQATTHTHTLNGSLTNPANNTPPYVNVVFAYNSSGGDASVPSGLIAFFDAAPPANWNTVSNAAPWIGNFLVGATSFGTTGGSSAAHGHGANVTITSDVPSATRDCGAGGTAAASGTHTHDVTYTVGSSSSTLPVYRDVMLAKYTAPADTSPPTPNPMTWSSAPANFSTTQIDMISTTGTDATLPVNYLFTNDNSSCGANAGTGGTSSAWQSAGTSYSDTGLQPNKCYGYTVTARDSVGTPNTGTASAISSTYTTANTPGTPALGSPTSSTLALTNAENSNPASNPTTYFAVQVVTTSPADATWLNQWVNASGNPSATAVWLTDAQLDALVLQGLQASTLYGVKVKARNQDTDETALSAEGQGTTSGAVLPSTITSCAGCHGYGAITDGTPRNSPEGTFPGSHNKHVVTYSKVCSVCHTTPATETSVDYGHRNGNIQMAGSVTYTKGASWAQTNAAFSGGDCSNTYCHSTGTSLTTPYAAPNTVPTWGGTLACNGCHGNATYTDYRRGASLYASGSPKQNAHRPHTDARGTAGADATECSDCHNTTTTTNTSITNTANHVDQAYTVAGGTATYPSGNDVSTAVAVATGYAGGNCANASCHPTGMTTAANTSTTIPWNDADASNYQCTDCHSINLTGGTTYHHALNTETYTPNPASETDYPTTIPQGNYSTGTNPASRKCLMCHVKHNISSNRMNTNAALTAPRAMNLRTGIAVTPTASSGYAATDYSATTPFGICLSCHASALTKDTARQASETNSTQTPAITQANYNTSAHQYNAATTMKTVGTATFNANCSKCHNAKNGEGTTTFQNNAASGKAFGTHDSSTRRLLAALGGTPGTDYEEGFCYRCHSKAADAIGGTKKTVDANDWYGAVTTMSAGSTDIYQAFQKASKHNVAGYSGLHKPSSTDETRAYLSANKHVECNDCHNPHEAGAGLHTQGTNTVSNSLKGVQGVAPTFSTTNWTAPTQPAATTTATKEYEICFKCHSSYNTALATWNANWTDVSLEFSTANQSYHPVVGALPATDPGANGSSRLATNQLTGGWAPGQTMYCSDCHGNDAASPAAQGPHGSARAFILKGTNTYWPVNASNALYTLGNNPTNNNHLAGLFCLNCHPVQSATGASFNNVHTEHAGPQLGDVACIRCHILVPHGGKMSRLIGDNNSTMPSRYAYQGTLSNMYLQSFTKNTQNGYQKGNCQSASTGCTTHSTAASENW